MESREDDESRSGMETETETEDWKTWSCTERNVQDYVDDSHGRYLHSGGDRTLNLLPMYAT